MIAAAPPQHRAGPSALPSAHAAGSTTKSRRSAPVTLMATRVQTRDRQLLAPLFGPWVYTATLRAFRILSVEGTTERFNRGDRIIVEPGAPPCDGRLVVLEESGSCSLHRVVRGADGQAMSVPDEPAMLPFPRSLTQVTVAGVVIAVVGRYKAHPYENREAAHPGIFRQQQPVPAEAHRDQSNSTVGPEPAVRRPLALARQLATLQACAALARSPQLQAALVREVVRVQNAARRIGAWASPKARRSS